MPKYNKPLNEILVEEFLPSLKANSTFSKQQFVEWLKKDYPDFADGTVTNWLTKISTNSKARLNWPIRKGKDDVLFKIEKNKFRPYNQKLDPPPFYLSLEELVTTKDNIDDIQRPEYDDEAELAFTDREGRKILRTHLYLERSRKCVSAFKQSLKSFACSKCGFDFEKVYGEIGRGFIEAHHIIPVATAGEREVKIKDYQAVCSNCHRMIHRIYPRVLTNLRDRQK